MITKKIKNIIPSIIPNTFRLLTYNIRYKPSFLVIGASKAGTTSLYHYLRKHPELTCPKFKDIGYFNISYNKGNKFYQSLFPLKVRNKNKIAFEVSADYLYHPQAPERIYNYNPQMRIIILLRDPVDRAYSNFHMQKRKGIENCETFEEAIQLEPERINISKKNLSLKEFRNNRFGYLDWSKYARHIKNWLVFFPKEQFLFIQSEALFKNPSKELAKLYQFIDSKEPTRKVVFSNEAKANYPAIMPNTYNKLKNYFIPYNQDLFAIIKETYLWQ